MGGEGVRVKTRRELGVALERAFERTGRFQIIEAMLPQGAVSSTLARFVAGIKKGH
jgi:indolepyruvate decarboxylase